MFNDKHGLIRMTKYFDELQVAMNTQVIGFDVTSRTANHALAKIFPEPHAIVQPKVPCPVLVNKFLIGVLPIIGVPSGVIGLSPVQYSALEKSPLVGKDL